MLQLCSKGRKKGKNINVCNTFTHGKQEQNRNTGRKLCELLAFQKKNIIKIWKITDDSSASLMFFMYLYRGMIST